MDAETQTADTGLPDGFDQFFRDRIQPELEQAEALRQKSVPVIWGFGGVFVLGVIVFASVLFLKGSGLPTILTVAGIAIVLMLIGGMGCSKAYGRVRDVLKSDLVAPICNYMGMAFDSKAEEFPFQRFIDAGLVSSEADNSSFEDHISGEHNGVRFSLCEASLTKKINGGDDDGGNEVTLFEGVALIFTFPKPFTGHTQVLARGGFLDAKHPGEEVHLEDPVFEHYFDVYSTDQVEARYILTPGFMERFLAFGQLLMGEEFPSLQDLQQPDAAGKYGCLSTAVAFTDQDMLIATRSLKDRFEGGSVFKPFEASVNRERAEALVKELQLVPEIIDIMNLENTSRA